MIVLHKMSGENKEIDKNATIPKILREGDRCMIYDFKIKPEDCIPMGCLCRSVFRLTYYNVRCCWNCHYYEHKCNTCSYFKMFGKEIPDNLKIPVDFRTHREIEASKAAKIAEDKVE